MNQTRTKTCWLFLAIAVTLVVNREARSDVTVMNAGKVVPPATAPELLAQNASYNTPTATNANLAPTNEPRPYNVNSRASAATNFEPSDSDIVFAQDCYHSAWYGRIEYFEWGEQDANNSGIESSNGPMYALGWTHCFDPERVRLEFFGGDTPFKHHFDDLGWMKSDVNTFGFRGEYEYLWPIPLEEITPAKGFLGLGTQVWFRDIKDLWSDRGELYSGWQETWWSVYPYAGLEDHWMLSDSVEVFALGRIGFTLWTYEHDTTVDMPPFHLRPNLIGQVQLGFRRNSFSAVLYFDVLTWSRSDGVHSDGVANGYAWYYPQTQMFTTGLQLGWNY
jgi:hypothetical protein